MISFGQRNWRWGLAVLVVHLALAISCGALEPVVSRGGMVVAGHPEAARAGVAILEQGGTAMDAAVTTGFALGVAEPYGSGIGGKCAILYYHAGTGTIQYIDGLDASGAGLDAEQLKAAGSEGRAEGVLGVGVPGLVAAMSLAHAEWGELPWQMLLQPAIELAREGFTMVPGMEVLFERRRDRILSNPECARLYLPEGGIPATGTRLANPDLAATMEVIARKGGDGFYKGDIARTMVIGLRAGGSQLTEDDFHAYRARISEPLSLDWNGFRVDTGGRPTTGGASALLSLAVLQGTGFPADRNLRDPRNLDQWGRAFRHIYPVVQATFADTEDYHRQWMELLQPKTLEELRERAFAQPAIAQVAAEKEPDVPDEAWTTHFVVADRKGNVASVTQSLSSHFGSGVVVPGTGVILNNSLKNFSFTDPEEVNYATPGKRPRSTIAPAIVFRSGRPVLAIGLPGGGSIPTTLSAVLLDHLLFGRDLGQAIEDQRFHLLRSWSMEPDSDTFQLESGTDSELAESLRQMGWKVETVSDAEFFGGITAIEIGPDGVLTGWADTRRTNKAMGVEALP